ncbi:MAG: hypothetical protein ABSF62_01870 [Bryobacteraceae bacterium]
MPVPVVIGLAVVLLAAALVAFRLIAAWWKYLGDRVITCPENHRSAGVIVDSRHAAWSGVAHAPQLRLSACSRWPERAGCGQECLSQIEASPEGCLVHRILVDWYAGKACASCGRPIGGIPPAGGKPALLLADGISVEWNQISAELLPETLAAAKPICFACHMAQTLVREHPEMVVDRHRPGGQVSNR